MFLYPRRWLLCAQLLLATKAFAQSSSSSCSATLTPSYPAPSLASGYEARLIATGLTSPRDITFDASGNLLVVEQGRGISTHSLTAQGSCVSVVNSHDVVLDSALNHGIALSNDGRTLYASSSAMVFSWPYNANSSTVTGNSTEIIMNMNGTDHTTRTIMMSNKVPGTMVVSRGSLSNLDPSAENINSGVSQVKAFNLANATFPIDFDTNGLLLGWGLRNNVGVVEHPATGGIWTVENSVDQMTRDGVDIHSNNPGEELNFLGYLNGTPYAAQGSNFGYPGCFAAWNVTELPQNAGLQVGNQFSIGTPNATLNDTYCLNETTAPRLTFQAHMAPLDILFDPAGATAWITFHGSWDRTVPVGYHLAAVEFANGSPVQPSNSTTAAVSIMANQDNLKCPGSCFRPVGLAWDSQGRLYMSSDATGEVYVITATNGTSNSTSGATPAGQAPPSTTSSSAAPSSWQSSLLVLSLASAFAFFMI